MKIVTYLLCISLGSLLGATGWAAEVLSSESINVAQMDVQSMMQQLPPSARQALQRGDVNALKSSLSPNQVQQVSQELQQLQQVQRSMGAHRGRSNNKSSGMTAAQQHVNNLQNAAQTRRLQVQKQQQSSRMRAASLALQQAQANSQAQAAGQQLRDTAKVQTVSQPVAGGQAQAAQGAEAMPGMATNTATNALNANSALNMSPERYQALQNIAAQALPLTPQEILLLRTRYNQTQSAARRKFITPPKPTSSTQIVKVSPGSQSPVIRLSQGFVSSIVFVDSTGAPWPIEAYDLGDPSAVNINWDHKSHIMMMQATTLYAYANMAIKLHNLDTPLVVTLVPGEHVVDYVATLRVQGRGPNAKPYVMSDSLSGKTDPVLLGILDGVAPMGATPLKIEGGEAEAWLTHGRIFLRTRMTVLSPGWIATLSSPDGTHAYEMPKTPAILVSRYGKFVELKVEGY